MRTHPLQLLLTAVASATVCACSDAAGKTITGSTAIGPAATTDVSMNVSGGGHSATYVSNGVMGDLSSYSQSADGLTLTEFYLTVQRGGTPSAPSTFLSYDVYECTFDPVNYVYTCSDLQGGFGAIPDDDFSVKAGSMRLHTNLAANPNFFSFGGAAGMLDITWRASNLYSARSTGTTEYTGLGYSSHSSGHAETTSASVTGSLAALSLPAGLIGDMGTSHSTSVYHTSH